MSFDSDLDRWITGNYGQDQFKGEAFCQDCTHYRAGHCTNEQWAYHGKPMEAEDACDEIEVCDPRDDEPHDFDERRDEDRDKR